MFLDALQTVGVRHVVTVHAERFAGDHVELSRVVEIQPDAEYGDLPTVSKLGFRDRRTPVDVGDAVGDENGDVRSVFAVTHVRSKNAGHHST